MISKCKNKTLCELLPRSDETQATLVLSTQEEVLRLTYLTLQTTYEVLWQVIPLKIGNFNQCSLWSLTTVAN